MPCHSIHLPLKASNVSITRYIDDLGTFVTTFLLAEWLIRPNFRQTQHNSFSYHFFLTPPLKLSETFFLQGVEDLPVFCVSLPKRIENLAWYMKRSWAYFPFLDPNTLLSQMELPTLVSISIYLSLFRCEKNSPCTLVTISADRSSWNANSRSASKGISRLSPIPMVYDRLHKGSPLVAMLSRAKSIHALASSFFKINSNMIISSTPRSSKLSLPLWFYNHNLTCNSHLSHACYISSPSHPPQINHPKYIPLRSDLFEKLTDKRLVKKSPALYAQRRFVTVFKRARASSFSNITGI